MIHGKLIGGTRASAGLLVLVVGLLAAAPLGAEAVRALPLVDLSQCCVESTEIMHARYFSPNLGRFLSVDPVGGEVGSSQSWNRYSYVLNNPLMHTDPQGMAVMVLDDLALELIRQTLPEEIRGQVVLDEAGLLDNASINAIDSSDSVSWILRNW